MRTIKQNGKKYQVKENKDWKEDFNKDFQAGDFVAKEIVDYFLIVLPPRNACPGYLQVGEPYNHVPDGSGRCRATYNTFTEEAAGIWKYCGHCFAGETEHRG